MRGFTGLAAAAALFTLGAGSADAAQTLSWSYSSSVIAYCAPGQCPNVNIAAQVTKSGADYNAATLLQTARGNAFSSAAPGDGGLLPDLHALVLSKPQPGAADIAASLVEGVQVYTWTGGAFDLDPQIFAGSLDYFASPAQGPASSLTAGFAILDASVLTNNDLADQWFRSGPGGRAFSGACDTPGAIGVADLGTVQQKGNVRLNIGATACRASLHLETGDQFVLWSKMFVRQATPGIVDASHTFHVTLSPNVSQATAQQLASSVQVESFAYAVPEPATWALMILGFGGVGASLRRRSPAQA